MALNQTDSLYLNFISEREGLNSIVKENAFLTYRIANGECFLANMFIDIEARGSGLCRAMITELGIVAKDEGAKVITANIHLNDPHATKTLQSALALGFEIAGANNNALLIILKLGGS